MDAFGIFHGDSVCVAVFIFDNQNHISYFKALFSFLKAMDLKAASVFILKD